MSGKIVLSQSLLNEVRFSTKRELRQIAEHGAESQSLLNEVRFSTNTNKGGKVKWKVAIPSK